MKVAGLWRTDVDDDPVGCGSGEGLESREPADLLGSLVDEELK
jgi:hypothetical protein